MAGQLELVPGHALAEGERLKPAGPGVEPGEAQQSCPESALSFLSGRPKEMKVKLLLSSTQTQLKWDNVWLLCPRLSWCYLTQTMCILNVSTLNAYFVMENELLGKWVGGLME